MEFLFILIGLLFGVLMITIIPMLADDRLTSFKKAFIHQFKNKEDVFIMFNVWFVIMLSFIVSITLCAFNNTFWHIDYLVMKGLWQK